MTEDEFFDSDIYECMLRIKGKVQNWRYERRNAYLIHASLIELKDRVDVLDLPLPFDEEIKEQMIRDREQTITESERVYLEATGQTYEEFIKRQKEKGHG